MTKNAGLKYGLLAGILTISYFLLFYLIGPRTVLHPGVWWSSLAIYLGGMYFAVMEEQRKLDQPINFREAIKPAFLVFVIANALFYLFYFVLFNQIDPELIEIQKEMLSARPDMFPEGKEPNLSITPGKTFFAFCYGLIGGFFISAAFAAFMVRNN